jgi:hypothetical protein
MKLTLSYLWTTSRLLLVINPNRSNNPPGDDSYCPHKLVLAFRKKTSRKMKLSVSICVHQWLKNKLPLTCVLVLLAVITSPAVAAEAAPIDAQATPETVALFHSLRNQMGKGILFGQQNSTLYGVGWHSRNGTKHGRSDCFDAVGAYPAVYGWDLNRIWNPITPKEQIPKNLALVKGLVVDAYERGGVNTFSWHIWNPLSDEKKSFYDTSKPAVKAILPGGEKHEWYKAELDRAAAFFHVPEDGRRHPGPHHFPALARAQRRLVLVGPQALWPGRLQSSVPLYGHLPQG